MSTVIRFEQISCMLHQMISDVHVISSVDPTLPLTHCKGPSCHSCQRIYVVPNTSFPTIQTSELVCISVVFCRHLCICFDSGASDLQHSLVVLVPFGH